MGHARNSRQKEGTAWKSKPMVCPINQNDLNWRLAKSFCGSQTTEASTNNHHAGYARVWGFSFADRDTISVHHCSVFLPSFSQACGPRNFTKFRAYQRFTDSRGCHSLPITSFFRSLLLPFAALVLTMVPSRSRRGTTGLCLHPGSKGR
jgi:hypothetical protein